MKKKHDEKNRNEGKNNKIFAFFWFNFNRKSTHTHTQKREKNTWTPHEMKHSRVLALCVFFPCFVAFECISFSLSVFASVCLFSANAHFQSILKLLSKHLGSEKSYEKNTKRRTNLILPKRNETKRSATHKGSRIQCCEFEQNALHNRRNPKTMIIFGERLSVWKT